MSEVKYERISADLVMKFFATGLMSFCGIVSETAMNVTFPTLINELNVSTSEVQWLTTGYLLVLSLVVPLSSFLPFSPPTSIRFCLWRFIPFLPSEATLQGSRWAFMLLFGLIVIAFCAITFALKSAKSN